MTDKLINVHDYDGKLRDVFIPTRPIINVKEKKDILKTIVPVLKNQDSQDTLLRIITDIDKPNGDNYQQENNLDASDILIELAQWLDNEDLIKCLDEQLSDAKNLGLCNSGRCTRLLQLWIAFNV